MRESKIKQSKRLFEATSAVIFTGEMVQAKKKAVLLRQLSKNEY
jgi:hypothetical protein